MQTIPKPTCLGGELEHKYNNHHCYTAVLFGDHCYTFGVDDDAFYYDTYRRIHKDKNGSNNSNWEILDAPWDGNRHIHLRPNQYRIRISTDGKKLFVSDTEIGRGPRTRTVWSTTDGVNWKDDTRANYEDAVGTLPIIPTPLEPNWAKSTKNSYYKIDKVNNYIPIPIDEIKAAAGRGETNFIVTEEHKNSYNNFLVSSVHPDSADGRDWKAL